MTYEVTFTYSDNTEMIYGFTSKIAREEFIEEELSNYRMIIKSVTRG